MSLKLKAVLLTLLPLCFAWPSGIQNNQVCLTFHVSHISAMELKEDVNFAINLFEVRGDEKYEVGCIKSDMTYEVQFESLKPNEAFFKGIMFKELVPRSAGRRERGEVIVERLKLPRNTRAGICGGNSITHDCPTEGSSCKLGKDGKTVNITYQSAVELVHAAEFRYTLVMTGAHYISNKTVSFPVCKNKTTTSSPPEPSSTTSSPPEPSSTTSSPTEPASTPESATIDHCEGFNPLENVKEAASGSPESHVTNSAALQENEHLQDFIVQEGVESVKENCGRKSENKNAEYFYQNSNTNVNYMCISEEKNRVTTCATGCTVDVTITDTNDENFGKKVPKKLCCKIKHVNDRSRDFNCVATTEEPLPNAAPSTIQCSGLVRITKQCECFLCEHVQR